MDYLDRDSVIRVTTTILTDSMPQEGTTPVARTLTSCTIAAIAEDFAKALNLGHDEKQQMFATIGLEH